MIHANYEMIAVEDGVVAIADMDDGGMSITNDAENVVERLSELLAEGQRLIYRDTDGIWDELCHKDGKFKGFKSLRAHSLQDAMAIMGVPV